MYRVIKSTFDYVILRDTGTLEDVTRYQDSLYLYYTFGGDLMEYNEGYLWKKRVKCSRESFLRSILLH